jgi:hypothetical protein
MAWFISIVSSGFLSGWYFIVNNYPVKETYEGDKLYFQTVQIGFVPYRKCVIVGANKSGFYIEIFPFLSLTPPVSIPWNNISVRKVVTAPFYPDIELKLRKVPWASIKIYQSQKDWIKQKAGDSWLEEK